MSNLTVSGDPRGTCFVFTSSAAGGAMRSGKALGFWLSFILVVVSHGVIVNSRKLCLRLGGESQSSDS